jgi:hypothetical protein
VDKNVYLGAGHLASCLGKGEKPWAWASGLLSALWRGQGRGG